MDGQVFDRIAKTLAEGRSRRSAVRALAGGVASGALAVRGGMASAAGRCKTVGQASKRTKTAAPVPTAMATSPASPRGRNRRPASAPTRPIRAAGRVATMASSVMPMSASHVGQKTPSAPPTFSVAPAPAPSTAAKTKETVCLRSDVHAPELTGGVRGAVSCSP